MPSHRPGSVESFYFAVGLRPVRACALGNDVQLSARVAPGVRPVGRPVVGQDSLHGEAMLGKPCHRALQHADRGRGLFVGADLGVGNASVVVNDSAHERCSDPGVIALAAFTGAPSGHARVDLAVSLTEELVPAAVGDIGEFGDIDMDQRPGMIMLVAAQRFTGDAVNARKPVYSASGQHSVHG
ncbi:hypothetical protein MSTE_01980 [Mycobacteroides stephanolepidis]|uniref:Uncharacterized protein n=1 Tax=[Mycobacterium] stephanolepidis TaxID=1520670 RepID=A0A1Z4EWE1_9MYCO|nr:hypothetical protein MSTE_01980 [[Mycobacterium] stephanolepidis]